MNKCEDNYIQGHPSEVFESLNRAIGQYKRNYTYVKVGITGRNPQERFNEHQRELEWERMVVLYRTTSENYANKLEAWLVEQHYDYITNTRSGGGSFLSPDGYFYLYVLLAN